LPVWAETVALSDWWTAPALGWTLDWSRIRLGNRLPLL